MWLLDLGNTRLKLAWATGDGAFVPVLALAHAEDDFEARLDAGLATRDGAQAWIASVAPEALRDRVERILARRGITCRQAASQADCLGLRIAYAEPGRLGVDRFLALLAARWRGGLWLLASFGSAITVDLLLETGEHAGGMIGIAPGHARAALLERFPVLDRGPAGDAGIDWAKDTPAALAAGIEAQSLGMVLLAHAEAVRRAGRVPPLLLSGGDAAAHLPALRARIAAPVELAEHLVLEGLGRFAGLQR